MVLVEAQACGKAVIAGQSGGTSETMIRGKTGEVIDCSKPDYIASELLSILNDKRYLSWAKAARGCASERFGWDAHVEQAKKLFL